jgi:hypothetical protein
MDGMNVGANDAGGRIVGLIHESSLGRVGIGSSRGVPTEQGGGGHDDGRGRARDRDC